MNVSKLISYPVTLKKTRALTTTGSLSLTPIIMQNETLIIPAWTRFQITRAVLPTTAWISISSMRKSRS